jgi:glucosamine-6-phosphate deaminase
MKVPYQFRKDLLKVNIYGSSVAVGIEAARSVHKILGSVLNSKGAARIILATGASQFDFYAALKSCDIEWKKITVFHLDEYMGMPVTHPASFRKYLKERILDQVKPGAVHFLQGDAPDEAAEIGRYEKLLLEKEIDLACIGIGENGHIAFNDPPVADFKDPVMVKNVELDAACRRQQFGEGWFESMDQVPTHALTLTIPAILRAKIISCVVPDKRKAQAVKDTLEGPVHTACPASILRTHPDASLFLDVDSASMLSVSR